MGISRRQFGGLALGSLAGAAMSGQAAAQSFRGATDCHVHIIGPPDKYPMVAGRPYTPPQASVAQLKAMLSRIGMSRVVLVQPSFYGTDNSCMLDAMAEIGPTARGVAVVPPNVTEATLRDLDAKGVKGIRINLESVGNRDPKVAAALLKTYADKIAPLKWHIQVFTVAPVIGQLVTPIADSKVPIVIDHFGMPQAAEGFRSKGFAALFDLVRARKVYVKLSAPYRVSKLADYKDTVPIAQTLIYAARDHMLWGTDWPHTNSIPGKPATEVTPFSKIDDPGLLRLFTSYYQDEPTRRMILVDNPAKLYGFPAAA